VIPLYHDFADETVLVFGGGSVGRRKARRFRREAEVIVVSPSFDDGFDELAGGGVDAEAGDATAADDGAGTLERVREAPDPEAVREWVARTEPALVVAATDDAAVNAAAEAAARERGLLVNRTDEQGGRDAGSVVVPATVRDDPVTVAISTGGNSPALARHLRERVEAELEGAGAMAELTGELRAELKADGVAPTERREAVRAVVRAPEVWKGLQEGTANARQEADRVVRATRE